MKNNWLMAVVALLVLSAAACKKENKAEQLAALDSAYQAGVLSKGEYDTKRLALMGPPPVTPAAPAPAALAPPNPEPGKPTPFATQSQAVPPGRTNAPPGTAQPAAATSPPAPPPAPAPAAQPAQAIPAPQPAAADEAEPRPLAGCVDAESKSGKVKGALQRFYPAPLNSVVAAARAALRSLDFAIHQDTGKDIEASKRRHIGAIVGAGGERLILHFETSQQGGHTGTLVTGETKKSFVGRVAQKSWTNVVLAQIACHLAARR